MIGMLIMMIVREGSRQPRPASGGAWEREARAAIAVAAAQGITLREDDLIYLDVHDLQTLRWRIERRHAARHAQGPRAV